MSVWHYTGISEDNSVISQGVDWATVCCIKSLITDLWYSIPGCFISKMQKHIFSIQNSKMRDQFDLSFSETV